MKKVFTIALFLALSLITLTLPTYASPDSKWVYDEPQVISKETKAYIQVLNEDVFPLYLHKPRFGVVVVNKFPKKLDKYQQEVFGSSDTRVENRDLLFVFSTEDKGYGLKIGDGFKKGSLLRQDIENDFMEEEIKKLLSEGDFDSAVMQISKQLKDLMSDDENGIYAQKEAAQEMEQTQKEPKDGSIEGLKPVTIIIFLVTIAVILAFIFFAL